MKADLRGLLLAAAHAIADEFEALRASPLDGFYMTDGPLPPRTSRETFNRRCNRGDVEGAERIAGRGRGYWRCSRAAWHRATTLRPAPPALRLVEKSDEQLADEMIQAAGFRRTR